MRPTPAPTNPVIDAPLTGFSNCHDGIIAQLEPLGELPNLLPVAQQVCTIADQSLQLFRVVVFDHHAEEEKDLFPAVLAAAIRGAEFDIAKGMVDALIAEHREIEAIWRTLEPGLAKLAKGQLTTRIDSQAVVSLVQKYRAHARLEEERFLPMAEQILGRQSKSMAELGLALHMRHVRRAAGRGLRGS